LFRFVFVLGVLFPLSFIIGSGGGKGRSFVPFAISCFSPAYLKGMTVQKVRGCPFFSPSVTPKVHSQHIKSVLPSVQIKNAKEKIRLAV
jgi:hypothetical protein